MWVVTQNMMPIRVVEVKKPDKDSPPNGETILDEPTVLGELYDFQMQLPNFYGMSPVFGILSTFETFQICWLPVIRADKIVKTPEASLQVESVQYSTLKKPLSTEKKPPPGFRPSKVNPVVHEIQDEIEDGKNVKEDNIKRDQVFHVSKIFCRTDKGKLAMRAVAAVLCKMLKSKPTHSAILLMI